MEIYGTLGPSCAQEDVLRRMFAEGMTGVRLNLSHVTLAASEPLLDVLAKAAAAEGVAAKLLIDMQGPELRIGKLVSPLTLREGEGVTLGSAGADIPIPAEAAGICTEGQTLLLDDGKLLLEVVGRESETVRAVVHRGGVLHARKSIALPGCTVDMPTMTDEDRENLASAAAYGVHGVMQPFVRGREDLDNVRSYLIAHGGADICLLAKVENQTGMAHLDELIDGCDEIVIARGDLGNAMPLWELPAAQKRIAARCRERGRAFMVVTQLLYTMEHSAVPSRAEVSDIFNAVLDGAHSVMVTGETAVGEYPAEVIRYLWHSVQAAEAYRAH